MTAKAVADARQQEKEQRDALLGRATRKWNAIARQLHKGALSASDVFGALQAIHDGKFVREGAMVVPDRPPFIGGLFAPPERQLEQVRRWNKKCRWRLPGEWFDRLGPAPAWPDGDLSCVVLEVALPDKDGVPGYVRTACDLWAIISRQHPKSWQWEKLHLDAEHLELLEGATYEPGLRWRIIDLGVNWDKTHGIRPVEVRDPQHSPNVDGFAALVHHPRFVRRMDGMTVPYLWISGFVVSVPGSDPRRGVPIVGFDRDDRRVDLDARGDGYRAPGCAVPARRGA